MGKKNKGKRRLSAGETGNSKKPATNCYIHSIKVARIPGAVDNNCNELGFKNWPTVITDSKVRGNILSRIFPDLKFTARTHGDFNEHKFCGPCFHKLNECGADGSGFKQSFALVAPNTKPCIVPHCESKKSKMYSLSTADRVFQAPGPGGESLADNIDSLAVLYGVDKQILIDRPEDAYLCSTHYQWGHQKHRRACSLCNKSTTCCHWVQRRELFQTDNFVDLSINHKNALVWCGLENANLKGKIAISLESMFTFCIHDETEHSWVCGRCSHAFRVDLPEAHAGVVEPIVAGTDESSWSEKAITAMSSLLPGFVLTLLSGTCSGHGRSSNPQGQIKNHSVNPNHQLDPPQKTPHNPSIICVY